MGLNCTNLCHPVTSDCRPELPDQAVPGDVVGSVGAEVGHIDHQRDTPLVELPHHVPVVEVVGRGLIHPMQDTVVS